MNCGELIRPGKLSLSNGERTLRNFPPAFSSLWLNLCSLRLPFFFTSSPVEIRGSGTRKVGRFSYWLEVDHPVCIWVGLSHGTDIISIKIVYNNAVWEALWCLTWNCCLLYADGQSTSYKSVTGAALAYAYGERLKQAPYTTAIQYSSTVCWGMRLAELWAQYRYELRSRTCLPTVYLMQTRVPRAPWC